MIDVAPAAGTLSFRYQRNTDAIAVPVGAASYNVSGNLMNVLQNSPAMALGVIASSGAAPAYSAKWDFIRVTHPGPYVLKAFPDQQVYAGQSSLSIPLELIFADDDGIGTLTFELSSNTNPALISQAQIDGTEMILALTAAIGEATLTIKATDNSGISVESSFKLSVVPELADIIHINSGGPGFTFDNTVWVSDQYFTGGSQYSRVTPVANTLNDVLYQTERFGNFTYSIPVPASGEYSVDLHFAEIYHGIANSSGAGARVFNVSVENNQFSLQNFDILQQTGSPATAIVVRAENIQVTDGILNINFTTVKDNAKISGISVFKYQSGSTIDNPPFVIASYPNQQVPGSQSVITIPLDEIFDDDNGVDALTFEVTNVSNPALVSSTEIVNTDLQVELNAVTGTTVIALRATDASEGFAETSFQIEILPSAEPGASVIHINSGGPAIQMGGFSWVADQYFSGGTTYTSTKAIANTTNDAIYQTERFGNVSYHIPVPQNGLYTVDIHLAEVYWTEIGQRVFHVSVENGQYTRQNIDLVAEVGPATALDLRAEPITVTDGFLDITLATVTNNAKISAISIYHYSAGSEVNEPPVLVTPANVTILEGQFWSFQVEASDPDPGDNLTYSATNLPASLAINPVTGLISGTIETSAASFPVTVRVTDPEGSFDEANFTITVSAGTPPTGLTIVSFTLINSITDTDVMPLTDGLFINLDNLPPSINIRANVSGSAGSVRFGWQGNPNYRVEGVAPYALGGDNNGNYSNLTIGVGTYTITATPFALPGASGTAGTPRTVTFIVGTADVNHPPVITISALPEFCRGSSVSIVPVASDPDGDPLTFKLGTGSDPLPSGLSLNPATGAVTGILANTVGESSPKQYNVIIVATDTDGATASASAAIVSKDCGSGMQVTSMVLINSATDTDVVTLFDGLVLNASDVPAQANIRADVNPPTVGSVKFAFQGNPKYRVENVAPYALGGDQNANYSNLTFGVGTYSVTATPYAQTGANGISGTPLSLTFRIVSSGGTSLRTESENSLEMMASEQSKDGRFVIYPNPTQREMFVRVYAEENAEFTFVMIGTLGRQIPMGTFSLPAGENVVEFELEPEKFRAGMYYLSIDRGSENIILKVAIR